MMIQILGTRGEIGTFAPNHLKHCGISVDDKILMDVAEPEYLNYCPEFILITHFDPDHAFFIAGSKK